MRIIVAGSGTVGANIATHLSRDEHDVVVVDLDGARLTELEDHIDVQTLVGNGCDPTVLRQGIGGRETQLLLAVTNEDNTNLVMGHVAKRLGIPRVVARVRSRFYLENTEVNYRDPFGIDLLLSPEILAANELSHFVSSPAALAIASLAQGRVQMRTVMLSPFSQFCMKPLKDLEVPEGLLIAAVRRGKEIIIPTGITELEGGDKVTLIGLPHVIEQVHPKFDTEQKTQIERSQHVTVAGAGETGLYLAELLESRKHHVTVIDLDHRRCELASERLKKAVVLQGDCTNVQMLKEENIHKMDYYIAATGDDESNVMSALLARELKVPKTACLIDRPDYVRVVEKVGIDVAISPRIAAANRVMALVKRGRIRSVTLLEEGQIEVTEYQALSKSAICGRELKDITLPKGSLIGAISRGNTVSIPRGHSMIKPGDIVITVSKDTAAEPLSELFQATAEPAKS